MMILLFYLDRFSTRKVTYAQDSHLWFSFEGILPVKKLTWRLSENIKHSQSSRLNQQRQFVSFETNIAHFQEPQKPQVDKPEMLFAIKPVVIYAWEFVIKKKKPFFYSALQQVVVDAFIFPFHASRNFSYLNCLMHKTLIIKVEEK